MVQYSYPSGGIGRKERKKYTFSNFRGVDASCAAINVDTTRAVESTNFVDRNGVLHKRYGWEQMYQFDDEINGFWEIILDGQKHSICYAGNKFYVLSKQYGWQLGYTSEKLVSRRIECYVSNDKAYFVGCGDFIVYRIEQYSYIFTSVEDDNDTYIPTTTAQILPQKLVQEGLHGQYVRDSVNLLTGWRKNTLVGRTIYEGTSLVYNLDGKPVGDTLRVETEKLIINMIKRESVSADVQVDDEVYALTIKATKKELTTSDVTELYNNDNEEDVVYPDIAYDALNEEEWSDDWVLKIGNAGLKWKRESNDVLTPRLISLKHPFRIYSLYWVDGIEELPIIRRYYRERFGEWIVNSAAATVTISNDETGSIITCEKASEDNVGNLVRVKVRAVKVDSTEEYTLDIPKGETSVSYKTDSIFDSVNILSAQTYFEYEECVANRVTIDLQYKEVNVKALYSGIVSASGKIEYINPNCKKLLRFSTAGYSYSDDETDISIDALGHMTVQKWGIIENSKSANVTVKFYTGTPNASLVTSCKFSTLYGVDGGSDRLFVANGEDKSKSNCIFFSDLDNFTYFPDTFTKVVGGTTNEIQGFIRLANGSMAALKTYSQNEPTVFVFNGGYIEGYYDADETEKYILPKFSTSGVSTTQGIVSPYACCNLADDSLFLSQNGVYALELSQGTDSQRFAKERSLPINNMLKECNLSELKEACSITHENKYYLAAKHYKQTADEIPVEGKTYYEKKNDEYILAETVNADLGMHRYYEQEDYVYVADAHYSFKPLGAMSDAPSYEWYPLKGIPVRTWFLINEQLFFGTLDGRICRFVKDLYCDVEKLYFAQDVTSSEAKGLSQSTVKVITPDWPNSSNPQRPRAAVDYINTFSIDKNTIINDIGDNNYEPDTLVFVSGHVRGRVYGEIVDLLNKELYIEKIYDDIDGESVFSGQIRLKYDKYSDEYIDFYAASSVIVELRKRRIVGASRLTPTFDFGMADYLKTMESFTIVMNGVNGGALSMDILTRNNYASANEALGQSSYSALSGIGYTSFNVPFQNSYTKRIRIRNFNYAIFRFYSDSPMDCSISSVSIMYKYNQASGGIR